MGRRSVSTTMRESVIALVAAIALVLASAVPSHAQTYEQALAGFAADSFGDTDAAIAAVAASGNPLAIKVIGALQDGRLLFNAEDKKIYVRDTSGKDPRRRHRPADSRRDAARPQGCASQQSPAPLH